MTAPVCPVDFYEISACFLCFCNYVNEYFPQKCHMRENRNELFSSLPTLLGMICNLC